MLVELFLCFDVFSVWSQFLQRLFQSVLEYFDALLPQLHRLFLHFFVFYVLFFRLKCVALLMFCLLVVDLLVVFSVVVVVVVVVVDLFVFR